MEEEAVEDDEGNDAAMALASFDGFLDLYDGEIVIRGEKAIVQNDIGYGKIFQSDDSHVNQSIVKLTKRKTGAYFKGPIVLYGNHDDTVGCADLDTQHLTLGLMGLSEQYQAFHYAAPDVIQKVKGVKVHITGEDARYDFRLSEEIEVSIQHPMVSRGERSESMAHVGLTLRIYQYTGQRSKQKVEGPIATQCGYSPAAWLHLNLDVDKPTSADYTSGGGIVRKHGVRRPLAAS